MKIAELEARIIHYETMEIENSKNSQMEIGQWRMKVANLEQELRKQLVVERAEFAGKLSQRVRENTELEHEITMLRQATEIQSLNSNSQVNELREEKIYLKGQLEVRDDELFKLRRREQELLALKRASSEKDTELEMLRRRVSEQHVRLEAEMTAMEVSVPPQVSDSMDSGTDSFSRAVSTRRGLADVDFQMSEEDTEMFLQARRRFGANK